MKINLGRILDINQARIQRLVSDIERAFGQMPENTRLSYTVTLNFSAPGAVPGITSQNVTVDGVELGDVVAVAAPIAVPAGFLPPVAEVSAADTITVRWAQITGVAADPDGAGADYSLEIWRR